MGFILDLIQIVITDQTQKHRFIGIKQAYFMDQDYNFAR